MADPFTSALVSDVVGKLSSEAIQEYCLPRKLKTDLSSLENTFKQIQGVLYDAEKKQTTQEGLKKWLKTLKSASLEVENVLDEAKTEAMIQKVHNSKHKERCFFTSRHKQIMVKTRIAHNVKNIIEKMQEIDAERSQFQLTPTIIREDAAGIGSAISNRETSSLMSKICGRDEEKKMIVDKICNPDIGITHDDDDVRVHAICGMGGIGKTALAHYVYNHETVKTHFEFKCWVYVSVVFDVKRIIKQLIKSIRVLEDKKLDEMSPDEMSLDEMSLDYLLRQLQSKLNEKKFFIIMDDVWLGHSSQDMEKWNELFNALNCGAKGSTVLITTQEEDAAQLMDKNIPELQHLGALSENDSWSLFKMLAFPGRGEGENLSPELEREGKEIVKKCKGLPLAVKSMGNLMSTKERVDQWQLVNNNFMVEKQDNGILTALTLSYDGLPPHMKICFAYCCVFSKGEEMSKDLLIELWMANGFIPSQGEVSLYVLGEEIFDCLVRGSFLQDVVEKDVYTGKICKMHDLMHGLAQYEMRHDCVLIRSGKELITPDKVLHLSLSCEDFEFLKRDLKKLRPIRSMLVFDEFYASIIKQIFSHVYLRVLYLNRIRSLRLPESIGKLIHLRYLKISRSNIEVLPESIINLQNLQTLILESCLQLRELPKGLRYMSNLQSLDTSYCPAIKHMPVGIKDLTNLRRLSEFVVGKVDGARIGELGSLNLLGWELELSRLENVGALRDAKNANLKDKNNLKSLKLMWSNSGAETNRKILGWEFRRSNHHLLDQLEPNLRLQELTIDGYKGKVISPRWMVNLVNLTSIQFYRLEKCAQLPPLGKLPSLERIVLYNMDSLKRFHEDDNATSKDESLFGSLQQLYIKRCWSLVSLPNNFPKLLSLELHACSKLRSLPAEIESFKDLNKITIQLCEIISRRCVKENGEDWPKISHILHRNIETPRSMDEDNDENEDKDDDSVNYTDEDSVENEDNDENGCKSCLC